MQKRGVKASLFLFSSMTFRTLFILAFVFYCFSNFAQQVVQLKPGSNGAVLKNDLIELHVHLDSLTEARVKDFVSGKRNIGLNPFDPERIDIQAEFFLQEGTDWKKKGQVFGFYYQDFKRDTMGNVEKWHWSQIDNGSGFRVRYSPSEAGEWKVVVYRSVNGRALEALTHHFNTVDSDIKGKLGLNGRFFQIDGNTFFPVGINLSHPRWMNDPIELRQGTGEYWYDIRELPAMPVAYVNYLKDLEKFAAAGGNYFRMMNFPFVNDIEFEHLNNYTDRLHIAWETDHIIEQCEKLDLKIHYVLTWANELNSPERTYNKLFWDWWANDYPWVEDDFGYCYQHELGLKEPHEFLTDERAIKFYKKKLRYMFARWGYSNAIGVVELMNEINLVFPDHPKERMFWQKNISEYLKNELQISYPISVNYAGVPDFEAGDSSYFLSSIDVITFNEYRIPELRSNFTYHLNNFKVLNKPFLFSEIGAGYGELAECEVFSEWMKDAWMTSLSGMSGMGLEWSQQRNFDLMGTYFPLIRSFLSDKDISLFRDFESDVRKDRHAELIAIKNRDGNEAMGVAHNTTWNFYTNRTADNLPCGQKLPKEVFRDYENVGDKRGKNALHLTGFKKRKRYAIDWYDASTGAFVGTTSDKASSKGKVRMRIPKLNQEHPMLIFKMHLSDQN